MTKHESWMKFALLEAEKAFSKNEIPVGAIVIYKNKIIAKAHNQVEILKDVTAHAEILAITSAENNLENKYLKDCTMYVTLEPCPMCATAIVMAKIPTLVFGAMDKNYGACGTVFDLTENKKLNHKAHTISGVLDKECGELLKEFFKKKRK